MSVLEGPLESTLQWARNFIADLAKGCDEDRHDLEDLSDSQKEALAYVVSDALISGKSKIRRAAAWITGALDYIPEDAPKLLTKLLGDRVALVRMAAAWACGELGDAGEVAVPGLISTLDDANNGVRFAAVSALRSLGPIAASAVEMLIQIAEEDETERTRATALLALAEIEPENPAVQELMSRELESPSAEQRFAATYGAAEGRAGTDTFSSLARNLDSADPYLATISVWAIGKLCQTNDQASTHLLAALQKMHWLQIEHSEEPGAEYVSIRPVFQEALESSLPATPDLGYKDFRLKFYLHVFRPAPKDDPSWIDEIVSHPWYLKLQRRRFGRAASAQERDEIRELVEVAREKFANRLRRNPTLGVQPQEFKLLPGFIKQHCRNIAWRLRTKYLADKKRHVSHNVEQLAGRADAEAETEVARQLEELIESHLSSEERDVARCRWIARLSIRATANTLGLTVSKVRTREASARQKARRFLQ